MVLLPLLISCDHDIASVGHPGDQAQLRLVPITAALEHRTGGREAVVTLRDEFSAVARRVPGGFGGVYFDDLGELNILLVDPDRATEAKAALASEAFVQVRNSRASARSLDVHAARIARANYSHDQLQEWLDAIVRVHSSAITVSGVVVRENRLLVSVARPVEEEAIRETLTELAIPSSAVMITVAPSAPPLQSLHSRFRPVPAGVQFVYRSGGSKKPACTLGPNAIRTLMWAPNDPEYGYLVPSHCSDKPFVDHGAWPNPVEHYFQPFVGGAGQYEHIGNKTIDTPLFDCPNDPSIGCRYSDAAFAIYPSYASGSMAKIARPASRNATPDEFDLNSGTPEFDIVGKLGWAYPGEIVEKVGRSTGWTGGEVYDGCMDITRPLKDGTQYRVLCAMIVHARAGVGDSGAPVFHMMGGSDVWLRGMVFTGVTEAPGASCNWEVDPLDPTIGGTYCTHFAASNLGGIENDLNPSLFAPLSFLQ